MTSGNRAQTSRKRGTQADSRTQRTIPSGWEKPTPDSGTDREDVLTPPFDVGKDYEATEHFSTGGMGCTYKGRNKESGQEVIIKIPHDMPGADARFERECETLHRLCQSATCPHIAQWLDSGSIEDRGRKRPYLVMELVRGSTLRQILQSRSVLPWDEVKVLLKHVNQALQFMNDSGVSHRDIKPDNLIYDAENKRWVLVDFGIAHDEGQQVMQTLISNEGTWDYMSPEQLRGKKVDIRSDIYSLGKVAWEALIGTCPRVGTEYPSKYVKDGKKNPSGSDKNVDGLIRMMTADSLEDRYESPVELSAALNDTAESVEEERRRRRRKKILFRTLLTVSLAGALSSVAWYSGDYVIGKKIRDAARGHNKYEAYRTIEKISRPLGMGNSAYHEVIPGLRRATGREGNEMRGEYNRLMGGEFDRLSTEDRLLRYENFLKKWKAAGYDDTQEYKDIDSKSEDLKMESELDKLMEPLVNGNLTTDACLEVDEVLKKYTKSKRVREFKEKLREQYKRAYEKDVNTKVSLHQYGAALEKLDELRQRSSVAIVAREWIDGLKKMVENERKTYFYANASENIRKACDARDFAGARNELNKYKEQYPNDVRTDQIAQKIAEQFESYIVDEVNQAHQNKSDTYYEDYLERIREFAESFPENEFSAYREKHATDLLQVAWWRIGDICRSSQNKGEVRIAELTRMEWSECKKEHRDYLNNFRNAVIGYIEQPSSYETHSWAVYWEERVPISGENKPNTYRVYRVHIERIVVSMSSGYYARMKGSFAADPEVSIRRIPKNMLHMFGMTGVLYKADGPKDRQYFELPVDSYYMFDIKDDTIHCELSDTDIFDKAPPLLGKGNINPENTVIWWEFDDGTTIKIYYKAG